jgi:hypothetical protein
MGFIPILMQLATVFAPMLQQKLSAALGVKDEKVANQMAGDLMNIVQTAAASVIAPVVTPEGPIAAPVVPSSIPPLQAAGMVMANPELKAKVEVAFAERLTAVMPLVEAIDKMERQAFQDSEDSRDNAAKRASLLRPGEWDMGPFLVKSTVALFAVLVGFILGIAGYQTVTAGQPTTEVWAAITGIVGTVLGIIGTFVAFRYGTSRQSAAKDVTIAEIARSR